MKSTTVRARIDAELKSDVEGILVNLGLTTSDVINVLFYQIRNNNGLPFELKVPNALTRRTLEDSAQGKGIKNFDSIDELFKDLDL